MTWLKRRLKAWVVIIPPAALILLNSIYDLDLSKEEQLIIAGAFTALFVERTPNAE